MQGVHYNTIAILHEIQVLASCVLYLGMAGSTESSVRATPHGFLKMRDSSSGTVSSRQQQSAGGGGEVWSMGHSYGESLSLSHSFTTILLHMCHHNKDLK